jgi:hypothetical protein
MARELEVVVVERALLCEEDEHQAPARVTRRVHRHGDERQVVVGGGGAAQVGQQTLVLRDRGRDDDAPLGGGAKERALVTPGPLAEDLPEVFRKLERPHRLEPPARGNEHRSRGPSERLRGGLGDRLERRGPG